MEESGENDKGSLDERDIDSDAEQEENQSNALNFQNEVWYSN